MLHMKTYPMKNKEIGEFNIVWLIKLEKCNVFNEKKSGFY